MSRTTPILLFVLFLLILLYYYNVDGNLSVFGWKVPLLSKTVAEEMLDRWHNCMRTDIQYLESSTENEFWNKLEVPVQECEKLHALRKLEMEPFQNSDETKYSVLPISGNTVSTIVTIGVGQDVAAETYLLQRVGNLSVRFYGADPIVTGNDELYQRVGTFFPFAVGNSSRMGTASVLLNGQYVNKRVIHVEFVHFLKEIIGKTFFDNIWVDGEYAEYELFDYFYQGGKLDQNGITVCQFNMEVHLPNQGQMRQFKTFIERLYKDRRYAFFRPVRGSHIRLFFLNFADSHCVKKYISN